MSRRLLLRLLLVLAGLGGGALAAVLWSGTAYASTTAQVTLPRVRVPAPPGVPVPAPAPRSAAPKATPPALPPAPVAIPPVVPRALEVVTPVVDRTVRTVRTVHTVAPLPLVATPTPARTHAITRSARLPFGAHAAPTARTHRSAVTRTHTRSSMVMRTASPVDRTKTPDSPRHRAPVRDLADDSNRAPQTANGMPFAVTRTPAVLADTRCDRVTFVTTRIPAAVPLRDVARPG